MNKRHTAEQIIGILREAAIAGTEVSLVCCKHNISPQTFARWRRKYGGMEVSDARKRNDLETANCHLNRLVAEQLLVIEGFKEFAGKK